MQSSFPLVNIPLSFHLPEYGQFKKRMLICRVCLPLDALSFFLTSLRSSYPGILRYQKPSFLVPPRNIASIMFGASGHPLPPALLQSSSSCSVSVCLVQSTGRIATFSSSLWCGSSCRGAPRVPLPPTILLCRCHRILR